MDETALSSWGILLEEMAQKSLGETGDLGLVEGEEIRADESQPAFRNDRRVGRKRANIGRSSIVASSGDDLAWSKEKRSDRRSLD